MNLRNFFTDLKRRNVYKVAIARLLARLDHIALTDLTHFRIFPRNLEPDFTHYLCEQRKENENL